MRSLVYRRELCKSMANLTNVRPRTNRLMMVALVGLAFAMCGGGDRSPTSPQPPQGPTTSDTLKAAAFDRRRLVGAAVQAGLLSNPQYSSVASREFNYVTAEYEMKWNIVEPSPGSPNFGPGDAIVGFAAANGMKVKGHTLIWHESMPSWVNTLSPADLRAAVERHIRTVVAHYRGRVHAWDVVNEAVADSGSSLRDTVFLQKLGDRYIADAFRLARETDPGALLFYNDYGGEGLSAKANRIHDCCGICWRVACPSTGWACRCTSPRPTVPPMTASPRTSGASRRSA